MYISSVKIAVGGAEALITMDLTWSISPGSCCSGSNWNKEKKPQNCHWCKRCYYLLPEDALFFVIEDGSKEGSCGWETLLLEPKQATCLQLFHRVLNLEAVDV